MIRLLILGPTGSMGKLISKLAWEDESINIVAACDIDNIGEALGGIAGFKDTNEIVIRDVNNIQKVINETNPNVVSDFTIAHATEKNCIICVENGIRCVIGTTALSQEFLTKFETLVQEHNAPAVIAPNMATGVNIIFKIASLLAEYLKDWDIEIIESHHTRKQDYYSGTSLTIAKKICDSIGVKMEDIITYGRPKGLGLRMKGAKNEIGMHCIRAGDITGDHIVLYAGPGERIELKHQIHSRNCLASGAIKAIKFIATTQENKIYSMKDVLGL